MGDFQATWQGQDAPFTLNLMPMGTFMVARVQFPLRSSRPNTYEAPSDAPSQETYSRHSPRFPLEQKRREPVREALLKETGLNEVESPEQRGVLSVGRGVCYTTVFRTQLYQTRDIHSSTLLSLKCFVTLLA